MIKLSSSAKKKIKVTIGFLIGVAVISQFFLVPDREAFYKSIENFNYHWILFAEGIHLLVLAISAHLIYIFIRKQYPISWFSHFQSFMVTQSAGVFIPGAMSEALIGPVLKNKGVELVQGNSAFVVSKIATGASLLIISFLFLLNLKADFSIYRWFLYGGVLLLTFFSLIYFFPTYLFLKHKKLWIQKAGTQLKVIQNSIVRDRKSLVACIFLSLFRSVLVGIYTYGFVRSIGGNTPLFILVGACSLATLSGFIPISPRNFGIYEGTFVFFAKTSVDSSQLLLCASLFSNLVGVTINYLVTAISFFPLRKKASTVSY